MRLGELGGAYERQRLEDALESAAHSDPDLISRIGKLRLETVPISKRSLLAQGVYRLGKTTFAKNDLAQALVAFRLAHSLIPDNPVFRDRAKLLETAIAERKMVPWRGSLISLQRQLGIVCTKTHCECSSHAQIARCRNLVGVGLKHKREGVTIYTLAPYYSRRGGERWTRLLKQVKKGFQAELLEPIADVAADFLLENTQEMTEVDVVIPIPPSIEKFGERGFAPNDIVARRIGSRLALPFISALRRIPGPSTREATAEELEAEFTIGASGAYGVSNLSVGDVSRQCRIVAKERSVPCASYKSDRGH